MTDEERAAMEWLDRTARDNEGALRAEYAHTLKAMLARPVMPEAPPPGAIKAMWAAWTEAERSVRGHNMEALYRALYAHLSKPATKQIPVWHVEWWDELANEPKVSVCSDYVIAEARAATWRQAGRACVRVTGPYSQGIPA